MKLGAQSFSQIAGNALSILIVASTAFADENVENPKYLAWSKFKPQTSVRYKTTTTTIEKGKETVKEAEYVVTLIDVNEEKLVVRTEIKSDVAGLKGAQFTEDVLRMIPLKAGEKKEQIGKLKGLAEEGTKKIKVAAGEYDAKWQKAKERFRTNESWTSDLVPGGLIRHIEIVAGPRTDTLTTELVEVKKP